MLKGTNRFLKKAATSTAKTSVNAARSVNDALGGYTDLAADALIKSTKVMNKAMPLTKKTEANIGNLWTGRKEGRGAVALGAVVGTGYMSYQTMKQTTLAPRTGEISYGGTAPIMNADGVGNTSQAPTLGAGGNMVFGLHNARKG